MLLWTSLEGVMRDLRPNLGFDFSAALEMVGSAGKRSTCTPLLAEAAIALTVNCAADMLLLGCRLLGAHVIVAGSGRGTGRLARLHVDSAIATNFPRVGHCIPE